MIELTAMGIAVPVGMLLAFSLIPSVLMNEAPRLAGRAIVGLLTIALVGLAITGWQVATEGPVSIDWGGGGMATPRFGMILDSVAVVLASLISLIGLVIARFALTSLRGDANQGQFFRWMGLTLGATLMMVLARDLIVFTLAWMLTSFGLHRLLTYYPDRPWAIWAARKKFLISRLGDALLISAVIVAAVTFGTTEYTALFARAEAMASGDDSGSGAMAAIGILLVLGAMTKSAQFPFHSWLPDTMETPTPVSALMHAGVINAGGILVIRLGPLVAQSPLALDLLALVGALTALYGSMVMLTQTSIKRSLAYSTIAQMGFMMLQCGLGAFSAALLHLVAHSAYKAHAFLSSGSVIDGAALRSVPAGNPISGRGRLVTLGVGLAFAAVAVFGLAPLAGLDLAHKPGGLVLGLVLTLAVAHICWQGLLSGHLSLAARGFASGLLLVSLYGIGYALADAIVVRGISYQRIPPSSLDTVVMLLVAAGFGAAFLLQAMLDRVTDHPWGRALYVHAMNGFYIDIPARRLTARIYGQPAPVQ